MRFAPFRRPWYPGYWTGGTLLMSGDQIEHAITYYVAWQLFQSPALAAFAVLSHWLPHLLFSVPFGALADRFDCRRIIQCGLVLFVIASLGWAAAIGFGVLAPWMCVALFSIHGLASAVWHPANQLMLYDLAGPADLPSAVRLMATGLQLGTFAGPVVGAALLFTLGPVPGLLVNALVYVPFFVVLLRVPVDGHAGGRPPERFRLRDVFAAVRELPRYPTVLVLVALQGAVAVLFGHALLPFLPAFGDVHGVDADGFAYGVLISAMAAGSVAGGLGLEFVRVRVGVRFAILATVVFGVAMVVFALSGWFWLAVAALAVAGAGSIVSHSAAAGIVQLEAPLDRRGRFIGVYNTASMGLRFVGGIVIGATVGAFGVGWGFAMPSALLAGIAMALLAVPVRARNAAGAATASEPGATAT